MNKVLDSFLTGLIEKYWAKSTCIDSEDTTLTMHITNEEKLLKSSVFELINKIIQMPETVPNVTMQLEDVAQTGADKILNLYDMHCS